MITVNEYVQKCAEHIKAGEPFISYWSPISSGCVHPAMTRPLFVNRFRRVIRDLYARDDVFPMYIVTFDGYQYSVEEKSVVAQRIYEHLDALIKGAQ